METVSVVYNLGGTFFQTPAWYTIHFLDDSDRRMASKAKEIPDVFHYNIAYYK